MWACVYAVSYFDTFRFGFDFHRPPTHTYGRYLEWVSTQPFFGYTIFNVTLSGDVEGVPDDAVLAVSRHGVAFVSTSALEVAKQWSYRQVCNLWGNFCSRSVAVDVVLS